MDRFKRTHLPADIAAGAGIRIYGDLIAGGDSRAARLDAGLARFAFLLVDLAFFRSQVVFALVLVAELLQDAGPFCDDHGRLVLGKGVLQRGLGFLERSSGLMI